MVENEAQTKTSQSRRPIILVAARYEEGHLHKTEKLAPNECGATVFIDAILAAGGLPVQMALTDDEDVLDQYVELADGVAIPGGPDVDPKLWGDERPYDESLLCHVRDACEIPLVRKVVQADKPLFTTCRGTQVLNVALGGSLDMDVPSISRREGSTSHDHADLLTRTCHEVEIDEGSLLERASGSRGYSVNSAHHCCVKDLGDGLLLSATSDDGIPECVEMPGKRFVLGVQWHPEYTWEKCEEDFNLWKAFVAAC